MGGPDIPIYKMRVVATLNSLALCEALLKQYIKKHFFKLKKWF